MASPRSPPPPSRSLRLNLTLRLSTLCALVATVSLLAPGTAAEYVQKNTTDVPGYKLLPGVTSVPAPVYVAPDQDWSGIDGKWNSFSVVVGTPPTNVRLQISTASQQIWIVNRQACIQNVTDPSTGNVTAVNQLNDECNDGRGRTYNQTASSSWRQKGYFQLWLEQKLGITGNGLFGFDTVSLGLAGEKGPSITNTTIGTVVTSNFWQGHFGLHPKPTNFSLFEDPIPSHMTRLFQQQNIPGLSFGYTAGSQYRGRTVLGSLTLGGYDASKIIKNDLTFTFTPDNERDLVVGVAGIKLDTNKGGIPMPSRDDLNMFIDSSVAEIWLPLDVCKALEQALGLKYDAKTDLYLVDDTLHESLVASNPSLTFTLGQKYTSDSTVNITLPYGALDLEASPPYRGLKNKTRYFPIRRANSTNQDQWVLGRTFLQEAYLAVDWEREYFTVSAVDWTYGKKSELTPIVSPQYATLLALPKPKKPLPMSAILGIALGVGFTVALLLVAVGWWFWRRRHQHKLALLKKQYEAEKATAAAAAKEQATLRTEEPPTSPTQESDAGTFILPKAELPGTSAMHYELGSDVKEKDGMVSEVENTERQIYEMPGDIPDRPEAGGRQLSEKESMVVRERIYNGIDPSGTPEVSPVTQEAPRRLAPISPYEVTMVNGRLPSNSNVSPITPRTPRDGALLEMSDTFFQLPPYRPRREGLSPEDTLLCPISPLEESTDRRRFSYES